jgi:transposase
MLRMDEINKIRKEFAINGQTINQIALKYNRSWETINSYINLSEKQIFDRGKRPSRENSVSNPEISNAINTYLDDEIRRKVHRKQRYTAKYLFKKVKEDHGYLGSMRSLRRLVRKLRDLRGQENIKKDSFLILEFPCGEYIQVDHGPTEVEISGKRVNGYLFVCCVPGTSLRYSQFYLTKAAEAWGDFHESFFGFFGGTFLKCIYDNDSVLKVSATGNTTKFCDELQIHYKFEAVFCNKAAGHEKGSVEGSVGYCRRNFLAGLPQFKSLDDINYHLFNCARESIKSDSHYETGLPLSSYFKDVSMVLSPLTTERCWGQWIKLKVDKFQCIKWKGHRYSVPEKYIGSRLKVFISVGNLKIYDEDQEITSHKRLFFEEQDSLVLDHYLLQLQQKPKAIQFSKVLNNEVFPQVVMDLRDRLRSKYDLRDGDLEFIKILFLKRRSSSEIFMSAIEFGLELGAINESSILSIMQQLQLDQANVTIPEKNLPEQCQIDIETHFNLSQYDSLTTNQRF